MTRNATSSQDCSLRRELIAVLMYVNRGAGRPKRSTMELVSPQTQLDRLVAASRMQ